MAFSWLARNRTQVVWFSVCLLCTKKSVTGFQVGESRSSPLEEYRDLYLRYMYTIGYPGHYRQDILQGSYFYDIYPIQ